MEEEIQNVKKTNDILFELGDIIEIIAPSNLEIHESVSLITYINDSKILLTDISTMKRFQLNWNENCEFTDESIIEVNLLNRSDVKGYARQNQLLPNIWIDIYFGGEIPINITGEITNLEEDMIEITTFPDLNVIYLDFQYKGIPENIPINNIIIREKPASIRNGSLSMIKQEIDEGNISGIPSEEIASMTFTETGESIIKIPENAKPDENIREVLHELYLDANSIIFGESLGEIKQLVEVPEGEQRYSIETQVNDLMDELLSNIPNSRRTKGVLDNIHLLIERFKQLREHFSKFDENENVYEAKLLGPLHKPLIERLVKLDTKLQWLIPVINHRNKIYDVEGMTGDEEEEQEQDLQQVGEDDVIGNKIGREIRSIENLQKQYYKGKEENRTLTYSSINNTIDSVIQPFLPPFPTSKHLATKPVLANIEGIIDNLNDFYSTVVNNKGFSKRRFVIQRYNLGLTRLDEQVLKNGKKIYKRVPMTPNDNITIKSFMMLPAPVVQYSKVNLNTTSIMEKANLNHNVFLLYRLFRKNTDVVPHIIDDLKMEFDYEKMETETKKNFLSGIQEFILSDELENTSDKYEKFLETIIPKTRSLIRIVRKYIKDKLSFVDVVQHLEPFMVYSSDISYKQYMEIRYFIKEKIKTIKIDYAKRANDFSIIRNTTYQANPKTNSILLILSEKKEFIDALFNSYKFLSNEKMDTTMSPQEMMSKFWELDNGNLFTNLTTSLLISLMTPNNLMDILDKPKIDEMTDVERIKANDCYRRYLAKRYESIKDLQKDNNAEEVFYDEEMDDTPYEILKKYKTDEKNMLPENFLEFLKENLIQKHDCPPEAAGDLAKTLIMGKKMIQDGEYAMLEIKPQLPSTVDESQLSEKEKSSVDIEQLVLKKTHYYRRLKNNWVRDDTINEHAFIDTNELFCNISKDCFKNKKNNVCEVSDDLSTRMKAMTQKKMIDEFDKRYTINVEELEQLLEKGLNENKRLLSKIQTLNEIQRYKSNNLAYEIGKLAYDSEIMTSPYLKLRDAILSQDDFSKKQFDIVRFTEKFSREPMIDQLEENQFWKYCLETNTKLIPSFLYELAREFINGGNYLLKLNEICHRNGILSDDGDSIVDKHSGYVIRKIDYSEEEGFDDAGFKISTHDLLEKELGSVMMEAIGKKEERVFDSEHAKTIYNVFSTICSNIDIPLDGVEDFVLATTQSLMEKVIVKEASYKARSDKQLKEKGKPLKEYSLYFNETLLTLTACVLFIKIQTAVPSFKTKKTYPGCVRSFSGYPLNGIEDMTGIKYMACVLQKTKSSIPPWDAIRSLKAPDLEKNMKMLLDGYIVNRSDVSELYQQKREYIVLNQELVSVEEHSIEKWHHFLPPVVDFSVKKSSQNIGSDFNKDLLDLLRKGHRDQHQQYNVLKSKISMFGYSIVESINDIVKSKELLLRTSSQVPFLENACCYDGIDLSNPIKYFANEENDILHKINAVRNMSLMAKNVKELSTASLFFHPHFTGIKYPTVSVNDLEENIYGAVIKYCNYDRNIPVPDEYKGICSEKPVNYNIYWSIDEKIEFLKKNGKRYTNDSLHELMKLVNRKNLVELTEVNHFTRADIMKQMIEALDREDSTIIQQNMREILRQLLDAYNPGQMKQEEDNVELENLINYLYVCNKKLYKQIMDFLGKYGKLSDDNFEKVNTFLFDLTTWQMERKDETGNMYYDEELYAVTKYMENAIFAMSKTYPNMLLNISKNPTVPKHWGFGDDPIVDKIEAFVVKYYSSIAKFKNDKIITRLLMEVTNRLVNLNLFAQNIPVITPIQKNGETYNALFSKKAIYLLYVNCFYSVIGEYIECSNDTDLLHADAEEFKDVRRDIIKANKNPSNRLEAERLGLDEDLVEAETDLLEYKITVGNAEELKERVCQLVLGILDIENKNKKAINFSYKNIIQHVRRFKEAEKKSIIESLGKISIEERKIENQLKNYKIGRWNVGQQKGLIQYNEATNDRETKDMISFIMQDMKQGTTDDINDMMIDVYNIELLTDEAETYVEVSNTNNVVDYRNETGNDENGYYDNEGENIMDFGEDYMDGQYYEEDRDD